MLNRFTFFRVSVAVCVIAIAGCSKETFGPTGTVDGQVLFNGSPLQPGTAVVFQHEEKGYLAFGQTDESGNYKISSWNNGNLPVGEYAVTIQPPKPAISEQDLDAHELIENPELIEQTIVKMDFPSRYRDAHTSQLRFMVQQGANRYEIQLKPDDTARARVVSHR